MICEKKDCTGCFACYNICPQNAIEMVEDEYGFVYPKVDKNKCINCNLCKKTCPSLNEIKFNKVIECFASRAKDPIIYHSTSSGGIATVISNFFIKEKGVVYGAAINDKNKIVHKRVTTLNELEKIKGSKYVHSYIEDAFKKIKEDLINQKEVLFIGTPCQVEGLKKFLNKDYTNLYCIDLICHGVPSQKFLKEDLKKYLKNDKIVDNITFRNNGDYCLKLKIGNKKIYRSSNESNYFKMFLNGYIFRKNCYNCKYARIERIGDITLGDFWGINEVSFSYDKGINCVLINSQKGKEIFNKIKDEILFQEKDLEIAIKENTQLKSPVKEGNEREEFLDNYLRKGYKQATLKTLGIKFYLKKPLCKIKRILKNNKVLYKFYKGVKKWKIID